VRSHIWLPVVVVFAGVSAAPAATPALIGEAELAIINHRIHGRIIDFTDHHGADQRFWSPALHQCRNMYVYVPPGYDPEQCYPLVIWLHGAMERERALPRRVIIPIDRAIVAGKMPPVIVAGPSGYIPGRQGSMFLNTKVGNYEDYIIHDVIPFLQAHFRIRPERQAHVLMGMSSGGWAAYVLALRYHDYFGEVVGFMPIVNTRWLDCHCRYRSKFDPCCWAWRTELDKNELMGIWYGIPVTFKSMVKPYWGWGDEGLAGLSEENAIELLDRYCIQNGEPAMYIGYIGRDQLHVDAQVESFLNVAHQRGIEVAVDYRPKTHAHTLYTGIQLIPNSLEWLGPRLAPYSPPLTVACPPLPEPPLENLPDD
jgi:hypothetical protein